MTEDQAWQMAHLSSKSDRLSSQIENIWTSMERWRAEAVHDQTVLRGMLMLIALLVVAQGVAFIWLSERNQVRNDERLQALEDRVDQLEKVAY
jgi:hypothetical protein